MLSDESEVATPTRLVFSLPPVTASVADSQLTNTTARPLTTQPSPTGLSKKEFFRAMVALTTLKRTSNFTKQQLSAWFCVLRRFPAKVVNLSVVELATSETRFPEVADLFRLCQRKMPRAYVPMAGDDDMGKPGKDVVRQIAQDMGLTVD
jgi:hypothetical protein